MKKTIVNLLNNSKQHMQNFSMHNNAHPFISGKNQRQERKNNFHTGMFDGVRYACM